MLCSYSMFNSDISCFGWESSETLVVSKNLVTDDINKLFISPKICLIANHFNIRYIFSRYLYTYHKLTYTCFLSQTSQNILTYLIKHTVYLRRYVPLPNTSPTISSDPPPHPLPLPHPVSFERPSQLESEKSQIILFFLIYWSQKILGALSPLSRVLTLYHAGFSLYGRIARQRKAPPWLTWRKCLHPFFMEQIIID